MDVTSYHHLPEQNNIFGSSPNSCSITILNWWIRKQEDENYNHKLSLSVLIMDIHQQHIDKYLLYPCICSLCLLFILRMMESMCRLWEDKNILIEKIDPDIAYHKYHACSEEASYCVAVVDNMALLCMRLQFWASLAPI